MKSMNFDFSDDLKFLKEEARRFLSVVCPPAAVRALLDDVEPGYDAGIWRSIVGQGWPGAWIPENYGGLGLGHIELCAIAEELGRAIAPVPFASSVYLFAEALMMAGTEAQKAKLLSGVADGTVIGCFATSEGPGPICASRIAVTVDNGMLTGVKIPVVDGAIATHAVTLAEENGAVSLYIAALDAVEREPLEAVDLSRGSARLNFVAAPAERLGEVGSGLEYMRRLHERAAVLIAFEQLGGAQRCLELARDFALQRFAFGRPIGSYQAIKHKLADMYVKIELARSHAYYGAWALSENAPELPLASAAARLSATDAFWFASKEAIQTFGGMGVTWEADLHLYYRRSCHLALVVGSTREWAQVLGSEIVRREAA
jgi:alkylation response protein AidB-like acyl-CoA dehydrogenase